jgi:Flp pilus assembly protein TadD
LQRGALRCQPDLADVHKVLGELLTNEGQNGEAFNHLRLALQLNPNGAQGAAALAANALSRLLVPIIP